MNELLETVEGRLRLQQFQDKKLRSLVADRSVALGFPREEAHRAVQSIDAVLWKFTLAGIHLERLWKFRENVGLDAVLEASLEAHRLTNAQTVAAAAELEAFLFQARAMLDMLMHHVLIACRVGFRGKMSTKKFRHAVRKAVDPFDAKAQAAARFLEGRVLAEDAWGAFLCSLRDRVAHQDRLHPGNDSGECASERILDWPTIRGATFERRAQDFENQAFEALTEIVPAVWDCDWIPGPYRPGMWGPA